MLQSYDVLSAVYDSDVAYDLQSRRYNV